MRTFLPAERTVESTYHHNHTVGVAKGRYRLLIQPVTALVTAPCQAASKPYARIQATAQYPPLRGTYQPGHARHHHSHRSEESVGRDAVHGFARQAHPRLAELDAAGYRPRHASLRGVQELAPTQQAQDKLDHWRHWIEQDLSNQMVALLVSREIQRSWNDILENGNWPPRGNGIFNNWVNINYRNSIMIAIRALTDKRKDTRSLMRLLMDLDKHRNLLPELDMDGSRIQNDIRQLSEMPSKVKKYVNLKIAHISTQQPGTALTLGEVHGVATDLYDIYHHWHQTICKVVAVPPTVTETLLDQWELLFTRPWITRAQAEQFSTERKKEYERRFGTWAYLRPDERGF